ncbi:MAG: D-alanyl-D-alanine carboxypeptidase/D-alanyl-D-alanine-endopeptidase [Bacteroidales bacterium]|nr:D-alanyl-D-alanine carboxypeptidase/D-alanyl-D-alanine-endopeptidase [Bacteroidales bacterium]
MKYCKKLLLLFFVACTGFASVAQNTDRLDFVVRHITRKPAVRHGSLAVCVHNINKDSTIYTRNEELAMLPGAVNKLFTTAAAYSRLGPKFTFETYLYYTGSIDKQGTLNGDIIVTGSGDPFFCSSRFTYTDSTFHRLMGGIRKMGIKRINGHIYADTSLFEDEMMHPSWQWADMGNGYASGVCGLNYNENSIDVHFRSGRRVGDPATITSSHPRVEFVNQVVTGPRDTICDIRFYGSPYGNSRICKGVVPLSTPDTHFRASMPRPALAMANDFTHYLRNHGITVSGEPSDHFTMPKQYKTVCIDTSFNLFTITALTMQTTSNIAAESLFKMLGCLRDGHGGYASGRKFMYDYFNELDINPSGVRVVDGSGISRENHVTAYFVAQFLDVVARQPFFWDFVGTLGISRKMPEYSIIPQVPEGCSLKIKTGNMSGVRNCVGYYTNADDEMFSFAILFNNFDADDVTMNGLIRDILEEIIRL